jgi:predicted permease
LGIRLLSGRDFDAGDRADTHPVAIINETMARVLWPGESALGKRFKDPGDTAWFDVVGVVNDVHPTLEVFRSSDTPFQTYTPLIQTPGYKAHWLSLAIRTSAPAPTVATALRAAVQQIDPDQPVYTIQTAREQMEQVTQGLKLVSRILGVFALIGLALSSVGIYGVISNVVAQRTTEIGIRMALGAQEHNVLWMVLGQGVRLSVIGIAIGIAASWGLVRVMDSMLPMIHGADPIAFSLVAVLLVAVALFACWLPARRAARVNPVVALRGD